MPMAPVSRTLPVVKSQLSFEIPFSSSTDQFQDPHKLGIQYHHLHQHNHNHKHKHNNNNRHSHSSHSHCQSRSYNHSNRYQEHRPDSPTSLEDSQSDSSLDSLDCSSDSSASFENETLKEPNPLLLKKHKDAHTDRLCATALVPLAQVATPPLSPAQPQFDQSSVQHQDAAESQDDILELSLTGGPSSPRHHDPITDNTNFTQETSSRAIDARKASSSDSKEVALDPLEASSQGLSQLEEKASTADMSTPVPALASEPESTFTPTPTPTCTSTPTGAPTPGAWQSLLPGVAPTPAPAPTAPTQSWSTLRSTSRASARSMGGYKSAEQRLHELLPIVLPPEYEDKLSMEMIDLFESLLPTEESHNRRTRLIKKIEDILHQEWPDQDIKAQPFGSTVNGLGTSTSDVDLCITTTWPGLNNVQMLANAFRKHGMEKVFCVPNAKVPIVKLWDPELHLSCDMNINTPLGLLNTRMIKTYVAIDPRVRPFAMIIKHWARKRVLDDAGNG
ncbi:hypothetical protein BGZ94_008943 [Podila epigama]|nr:hypothetical protein BGZ94_008943 [Podila epigama]